MTGDPDLAPKRFGIVLPGNAVRENLDLAHYADSRGVDSLWVIETRLSTDAIGPMAAYASATDRIKVGSGIIPIWTRNPALVAQTFATLDLLAPGRVILGLGAWWEPLASRTGVQRNRPLRMMREMVESVRMMLSMEGPVSYDGEFVHMDNLYLDHGELEPHDVKIYIGGVGPRMLRLAGGIADGVVLNNYQTTDAVRRGVAEIKAGAEAAGRSFDDIERVKLLLVRMTRNKKAALQAIKPRLAQYLAQQPHIEGPSGADPELSKRLRATIPWPATYQQCVEGGNLVSDELVDSLVCCGDPDEVRARIAEYLDAGATVPIVSSPNRAAIDFMAQGF